MLYCAGGCGGDEARDDDRCANGDNKIEVKIFPETRSIAKRSPPYRINSDLYLAVK